MAKVRLYTGALLLVAALWIVAEGLALELSTGERSAGAWTSGPDVSLHSSSPSALEQLHAHDHVVFLLGRCSAEMTWRHRRDRGLDACIAHAR